MQVLDQSASISVSAAALRSTRTLGALKTRMFLGLLRSMNRVVYVRVRKNHFTVRNARNGETVEAFASTPFTTRRLLVGDFIAASDSLRLLFYQLYKGSFVSPSPKAIVHPLEFVEDGLSPVEERVLRELVESAGAHKSDIHIGSELRDDEVLEKAAKL